MRIHIEHFTRIYHVLLIDDAPVGLDATVTLLR